MPRDGSIFCAPCADLDLDLSATDHAIKAEAGGGGGVSVSASSESLARDKNIVSRQAAIAPSHAPCHAPVPFNLQSPGGTTSYESPVRGQGGGRGVSRGTTSRYLDDDDDDDDSDQVYHPPRSVPLSDGRRRVPPRPSAGRMGNRGQEIQRRRRTRSRRSDPASRPVEGSTSDTPAVPAAGEFHALCSGYSSDNVDPTSGGRRHVVSTAAQTTAGNDVTGVGRRSMSDAVRRYLEAAMAWDERRQCSTCSSSSSDSSSEFDYYLDRPGGLTTSGLGRSSSPIHEQRCSPAVKQCVIS